MRTYAIIVDLEAYRLKELKDATKPQSLQEANSVIAATLHSWGFFFCLESLYLGESYVDAIRCILAIQNLTRTYTWFEPVVSVARMLRIEEQDDLMPAIQAVLTSKTKHVTLAA